MFLLITLQLTLCFYAINSLTIDNLVSAGKSSVVNQILKNAQQWSPRRPNQLLDEKIKTEIDSLEKQQQRLPFDVSKIDGNWRLLWTTEKETLFFMRYGFFGSPCVEVSQKISVSQGRIDNIIDFSHNKQLAVEGLWEIDQDVERRVNFQFTKARLSFGSLRLPLPPVGQGWFDNVYVDDKVRIVKDIRGDYLITSRLSKV
eukprot:gene2409-2642_t